MKNLHLLLITLGGSLLLIIGVTFLFSRQQEQSTSVTQAQLAEGARHFYSSTVSEATPSASPRASQSPTATEAATASDSAEPVKEKIIVTEFSDLQCPACRASYQLKNEIFAQYSPSEVEFVYRHFPLTSIHNKAQLAAEVSEVAAKYNKFWPMHDKLFETQEDWTDLSVDEAKSKFIEYAVELGMNKDDFSKSLEDGSVKQAVQTDANLANQLNISSTPTFFVNDKKVTAPEVIPTIEQIRQE